MARFSLKRNQRSFHLMWIGETASAVGNGLSNFALSIWVYQQTGSASLFALINFVATVPSVILLPVIGVLVDRWHLRRTMIWSNAGAGLSILGILLLALTSRLEVWHIFVALLLRAIFLAFIEPAYMASISLLVPKERLPRAAGMTESSQAARLVVSPLLAGLLMGVISIAAITLIDLVSYALAIITLLMITLSSPDRTLIAGEQRSIKREVAEGWSYVKNRPGLLSLLIYFAFVNFFLGVEVVLLAPLVLNFSSIASVGLTLSVASSGFLIASLVTAVWGTPKNHVKVIFGFGLLFILSGMAIGLRPSLPLVITAAFFMNFALPFMNAATQAIWLRKTPVAIQGRVFAARRLAVLSVMPLSFLIAGPLGEKVFEPLLDQDSPLQRYLRLLVGPGRGRGLALVFIAAGLLTMLVQLGLYLYSPVRRIESDLPDISHSPLNASNGATLVARRDGT